MRRITKAALGGLAGCALVLGGTQVAVGSLEGTYKFLRDDLLDPEQSIKNDGAFESAKAKTTITQTNGTTTFAIRVTGIDTSFEVDEYGAHLHVGDCGKTGGHYQDQTPEPGVVGTGLKWVNPDNEVWLGLVPDVEGMAFAQTTVNFVPDDDKYPDFALEKMSIVIHEGPLLSPGPGPKQACFPLSVPQWSDGVV